MEIETRLGELFRIRTELRRKIERQTKIAAEPDAPMQVGEGEREKAASGDGFCCSANTLGQYCGKKPKGISVTERGDTLTVVSRLSEGEHTYLYFDKHWEPTELFREGVFSVRVKVVEQEGLFRPVLFYLGRNGKRHSHAFFPFQIPAALSIPEGCTLQLGLRIEGPGRLDMVELRFGEPTIYQICELDYPARIDSKLRALPESRGGRYYEPYSGKIGMIADQFLYDAFRDAAQVIPVTPENYEETIEQIDFLLLASAWHGLRSEWDGMTKPESEAGKCILRVVERCRERGKSVVFYSKEDPPNYAHFVWIAKHCDVIFTSAEEMIPRYREDCGTERVASLCFGINPLIHNPVGIGCVQPEPEVIFSGSWMAKYPDRIAKLQILFDGVLQSGKRLKIIDRNFYSKDARYLFPEQYYPFVSPAVDHERLQKVHKLYQWAININSVTDSHTMFANRVYELQANGNLLLSNFSLGVSEKFDGVFILEDKEQAAELFHRMDEEEIYRRRIAGVRRVMTGETTFDRLQQITEALGLPYTVSDRRAAVVVGTPSSELLEDFAAQSYRNRCLCTEEELVDHWEEIDIVAFWHPALRYGPHYLEDMCNGFKYTDCDYITKNGIFRNGDDPEGREHDYVSGYRSKFATVFWRKAFRCEELLQLAESMALQNGYSIDRFEIECMNDQ